MHIRLIVLWMLLCPLTSATAQLGAEVWLPGLSIGINLPAYPELVRVPGYPVYYAPQVNSNYFFYDGMYWVYQRDNWYRSSWYNGPWWPVTPETVPLFILRVPVRYYRHAPAYFHAWGSDAPPHWGEHWGSGWEKQHRGWDSWNRSALPPPAPLPAYQKQYSGSRYPRVEQQYGVQTQYYRYQPRDTVVQQHYEAQRVQSAPVMPTPAKPRPPQQGTPPPNDQRTSNRPAASPQGSPPIEHQKQPHQQQQQGSAQRDKESPGQGREKDRGNEDKHDGERGK